MDTGKQSKLQLNKKLVRERYRKEERILKRAERMSKRIDALRNDASVQDAGSFGQEITVSIFNKTGKLIKETRHKE